jgi:hypothetical protein
MICTYCRKFQESELRENLRDGKGKVIHQTRYCPTKDDMMEGKSQKCENFAPVPTFWCNFNDQWLDIKCCYKRQEIKYEGCGKCRQKVMINELEERPKPVLIKRSIQPILLKKRRICNE